MPFNVLFVFPALYGIIQRSTFIVVEEIPYISIIFKLLIYVLFSGFLCALYFFICSYRIFICLSTVGSKPFLKSKIKRKTLVYLALKKALWISEHTRSDSMMLSLVIAVILGF